MVLFRSAVSPAPAAEPKCLAGSPEKRLPGRKAVSSEQAMQELQRMKNMQVTREQMRRLVAFLDETGDAVKHYRSEILSALTSQASCCPWAMVLHYKILHSLTKLHKNRVIASVHALLAAHPASTHFTITNSLFALLVSWSASLKKECYHLDALQRRKDKLQKKHFCPPPYVSFQRTDYDDDNISLCSCDIDQF